MSYARASQDVTLDASGDGPVATCFRTKEPYFLKDAQSASLKRQELVKEFEIASIAFIPTDGGVIEYGTTLGRETAEWETIDDAYIDVLPSELLRRAMADGANEIIFWKRVEDKYVMR